MSLAECPEVTEALFAPDSHQAQLEYKNKTTGTTAETARGVANVASDPSPFAWLPADMLQYLQRGIRIDRETVRRLARMKLLEGIYESEGRQHADDLKVIVVHQPVVVLIGSNIGSLVSIFFPI